MSKKVSISVPDELHEKMAKWRKSLNFSKIFQDVVSNEIGKKENYLTKLKENETPIDKIFKNGNFATAEDQYQTGKIPG